MLAKEFRFSYIALLMLAFSVVFQLPAQTKLGLHYTAEELVIWKERAQKGPYKNTGDVSTNSPGDWARILASANAYISSDPTKNYLSDRWNGGYQGTGYVPEGFTSTITGYEPKGKIDKMMNAAFVYLITKDTKYSSRVKNEILNYYIKNPLMDFSNQSRWGLGANSFNDINPGFFTAAGLTKLVYAYDYVKDTFTESEKALVNAWLYKVGNFFRKVVDEKLNPLYTDRERGIIADPTARAYNSNGYRTHDNGYEIPNMAHWYNNRRGDMVRLFTMVGILLNDPTMKKSAKLFFKELLKYGIFPDGTMNEYYRGLESKPEQGYQYSLVTVSQMVEIADVFAREGDKELYNYATSDGIAATKGGNKTLLLVIQNVGKYIDGSYTRYFPGKAGQANYKLNGISPLENKHYTFDTWFAQANTYYKDSNFTSIYLRRKSGTPSYPSRATNIGFYQPWSGSFGTFPGKLFMFGQMEDKVNPYPGTAENNTPALSVATSSKNITCNGISDGAASVTATGGTTPYTYLWSNGSTTASVEGLKAGAYSVTVTDKAGSKQSKTVTLTQPAALTLTNQVTNETASTKDGSITLMVSGGSGSYKYSWSNGATTKNVSGLTADSYIVTVTDQNGCTTTQTINVGKTNEQPSLAALSTTVSFTNITCNGASNGAASVTATGGTAPYTYLWSNGSTTASVEGLKAGAYSVTVTDKTGSKQSRNITIIQPAPLIINKTVVNESSGKDGAITLAVQGGTGSYLYTWSNGATTKDVSALAAGNYTVTVTDQNKCAVSQTITVGKTISQQIAVLSFTLINADTDQVIATYDPLADGATLNLSTLPTRNLNIRANTTSNQAISRVQFALNGNANYRSESTAPYALAGNDESNYNSLQFKPGKYTLTATPYNNNESGKALNITFNVIDQITNPEVPYSDANAVKPSILFSPNDDGINDFWIIENIELHPEYQVLIFNRNGEKIFDAKSYVNNWDGRLNGKPLMAEAYYYVIKSNDRTNIKTGTVTLIR